MNDSFDGVSVVVVMQAWLQTTFATKIAFLEFVYEYVALQMSQKNLFDVGRNKRAQDFGNIICVEDQ